MQLSQSAPIGKQVGHRVHLAPQQIQVGGRPIMMRRNDDVAGTEVAALAAEGEVDIEGERLVGPPVGPPQPLRIGVRPHTLVEFRRGGVAGVARAGLLETIQECGESIAIHGAPCGVSHGHQSSATLSRKDARNSETVFHLLGPGASSP